MKSGKEKYGKYYRRNGGFHLNFLGLEDSALGALTIKQLEKHVAAFHRGEESSENAIRALQTLRKMINSSLELTENHVLFLLFSAEKAVIKESKEEKKHLKEKNNE